MIDEKWLDERQINWEQLLPVNNDDVMVAENLELIRLARLGLKYDKLLSASEKLRQAIGIALDGFCAEESDLTDIQICSRNHLHKALADYEKIMDGES